MPRYLVRVEVPATWVVEVHAEDEDEASIAVREIVGDVAGTPGTGELVDEFGTLVIDWGEADWTLPEEVQE